MTTRFKAYSVAFLISAACWGLAFHLGAQVFGGDGSVDAMNTASVK